MSLKINDRLMGWRISQLVISNYKDVKTLFFVFLFVTVVIIIRVEVTMCLFARCDCYEVLWYSKLLILLGLLLQ